MARLSRDAKQIVDKFASAIAGVGRGSPVAMREASAYIRTSSFWTATSPEENAMIQAFAEYVSTEASRLERVYTEAYAQK